MREQRRDLISGGHGMELGWADLWSMLGTLDCSDGQGGANECSETVPNCHVLPSFPFPPQHGKTMLELIKAADCLEMEGEGEGRVWGPDISLMHNNLVARSGIKTSFPEPLLILVSNA